MIPFTLTSPPGRFLLRFVQESNAIEEVSLPDSWLVRTWREASGHMGAARLALQLAEERRAVTIEDLCWWQSAIVREQLRHGHWIANEHIGHLRVKKMRMTGKPPFAPPESVEPSLARLLAELNEGLLAGVNGLDLAARTHWRYELIHPFADGNGRSGRLLALYVHRWLRLPPVLFTVGDRQSRYFRAFTQDGPASMIAYFQEHQHASDPWADRQPEEPLPAH